jgi:hypothetical protein
MHAMYRGMGPTLVRAFAMDGASFLGYTSTLQSLGGTVGGGGQERSRGSEQGPQTVQGRDGAGDGAQRVAADGCQGLRQSSAAL